MRGLIGIFDPKKMTPEQIYKKVNEYLALQKRLKKKKSTN
jgi:hypothetical protein